MGTGKADKVREVMDRIVALFESGDVPAAIGKATFPAPNIPMSRWSLSNRTIAMLHGTGDARGYRQWQEVGRHVRKGARAFYILGPRMVKVEEEGPDGEKREGTRLAGFVAIPVFAAESTNGEPLDYESHPLPSHPLRHVAEKWGVKVRTAGFQGSAYGWTDGREIVLCTPDELTFFHELGHVADCRENDLRGGQHSDQEIVAQLVAAVLARLVGRKDPNEGYSFEYVRGYARKWFPKATPEDAIRKACHRVLTRACRAVERILEAAEGKEVASPAAAAA